VIEPDWALWLAGAFGFLWGSFLDQVISRIPSTTAPPIIHEGHALGLFHPRRSICLSCGRQVPWYNNIPIVSYLFQLGRCRFCGEPIGWRTLLVEVLTPVCFMGVHPLVSGRGPVGGLVVYLTTSWVLVAFWFWLVGAAFLISAACVFLGLVIELPTM